MFISFFLTAQNVTASPKRYIIYDLDDTLFDTAFRSLYVLHRIGMELGIEELQRLEYTQVSFYCDETLQNVGLNDPVLIEDICGHYDSDPKNNTLKKSKWGQIFFGDSSSIHYDRPLPGAKEFVERTMNETGATIIYLTARFEQTQGKGTKRQLEFYGFPGFRRNTSDCANLIMRPTVTMYPDSQFKEVVLKDLLQNGVVIAAFDDLVSNANMFRRVLPSKVPVIRPNRNILDTKKLNGGIEQITNYIHNVAIDKHGKSRIVAPNQQQLSDVLYRAKQIP